MRRISGVVVGSTITDDISSRILSMEVSLTTDMASQVTITVADPGLRMMRANYFQLRQQITYLDQKWEISSLEVSPSNAGEQVVAECRLQAIQKLKRDKGSKTFSDGSPTAFAQARAAEVGLEFFGESTPAKRTISRVRNDRTDESTWDVLKKLANDNQFWCFESDGRLFFTSQQFLLGKFSLIKESTNPGFLSTRINWATNGRLIQESTQPRFIQVATPIPGPEGRPPLAQGASGVHVAYLQTVLRDRAGQKIPLDSIFSAATKKAVTALQTLYGIADNRGQVGALTWEVVDFLASGLEQVGGLSPDQFSIVPITVPTVRKSDDAPEEMSASFDVEQELGRDLRPGMTVYIDGIPGFDANCLITDVSWSEGTNEPVTVSARTTEIPGSSKDREKALKKIDLTGGGFPTVDGGGIF